MQETLAMEKFGKSQKPGQPPWPVTAASSDMCPKRPAFAEKSKHGPPLWTKLTMQVQMERTFR
jgi:hypothetical protein